MFLIDVFKLIQTFLLFTVVSDIQKLFGVNISIAYLLSLIYVLLTSIYPIILSFTSFKDSIVYDITEIKVT